MRRPSRTDERPTLKDAVSSRSVGSVSPGLQARPDLGEQLLGDELVGVPLLDRFPHASRRSLSDKPTATGRSLEHRHSALQWRIRAALTSLTTIRIVADCLTIRLIQLDPKGDHGDQNAHRACDRTRRGARRHIRGRRAGPLAPDDGGEAARHRHLALPVGGLLRPGQGCDEGLQAVGRRGQQARRRARPQGASSRSWTTRAARTRSSRTTRR